MQDTIIAFLNNAPTERSVVRLGNIYFPRLPL